MPKISIDNLQARQKAADNAIDYKTIAESASATNLPDGAKYKAALDLARNTFGNEQYSDKQLREEIDRQLVNLGAEHTGAEYRNENAFNQFIRGMNEGLNDFNTMIGGGIDWLFDNTAGAIVPAWKDLFSAEDAAIVPDIAESIGLALIPYVGPALAGGKALLQNSDNIYEAMTGYDATTLEDLSDFQRAGKGASAALDTALSVFGANGLKAGTKAAEKAGAKVASKTAKEATEEAEAATEKQLAKAMAEAEGSEAEEIAAKESAKVAEEMAEDTADSSAKTAGNIFDRMKENRAAALQEEADANAVSRFNRIIDRVTKGKKTEQSIGGLPGVLSRTLRGGLGGAAYNTAASTAALASVSDNPQEFVDRMASFTDDPNSIVRSIVNAAALPIGTRAGMGQAMLAKGIARNSMNKAGTRATPNGLRNNRYNALRASNVNTNVDDILMNDEEDLEEDYGQQALLNYFAALRGNRS